MVVLSKVTGFCTFYNAVTTGPNLAIERAVVGVVIVSIVAVFIGVDHGVPTSCQGACGTACIGQRIGVVGPVITLLIAGGTRCQVSANKAVATSGGYAAERTTAGVAVGDTQVTSFLAFPDEVVTAARNFTGECTGGSVAVGSPIVATFSARHVAITTIG